MSGGALLLNYGLTDGRNSVSDGGLVGQDGEAEPKPPTFKDSAGRTRYMKDTHMRLVRVLVYEGCAVREAAKAVGMSAHAAYNVLERQHVASYLDTLMQGRLKAAGVLALETQVNLLHSPEHSVRHQAAKDLLNRAGAEGPQQGRSAAVSINISLGSEPGARTEKGVIEGELV